MKKRKTYSKKRSSADNLFIASFLAYPLLLCAVFYVYVNFSSILLAFKHYDFLGNSSWVGFDNFGLFIQNISGSSEKWAIALGNSLKMYIISLVICLPLYVLFSYILFKKCFMHQGLRIIVMVPQIISGLIMCLVFKKFVEGAVPGLMMQTFNLDSFPNLLQNPNYAFNTTLFYMIWISFSTSLIVYPNAMKEIDDSILEASKLDGVGNIFQDLRYIIIPLIFPTISTFLVTGFAAIFINAGVIPTFYMHSAPASTVNVGYMYWSGVAYATTYNGFPMLAAGGLMLTLVTAPLTMLLRHILEKYGPLAEY